MVKTDEELKTFLKNIKRENIIFKKHFYDKKKEDRAYLNEEMAIKAIRDVKSFIGIQNQSTQTEEKYRLGIKLSNNYNLVVVIKIQEKALYIITAWKTSRRWQKTMQK